MAFRIITRAEWGARYANGFGYRKVGALDKWLHHSVTIAPDLVAPFDDDFAAIRRLEEIGQARFGGGMSYTTLFTPAGLIFEGLGIDRIGSHTADRNTGSAGLCLVGNYESAPPSSQQEAAIAWYLNRGVQNGWWPDNAITGGHYKVYATACPGAQAIARIDDINSLADSGDYTEENGMTAAEVWAHKIKNPVTERDDPAFEFLRWICPERLQPLLWDEYTKRNENGDPVSMSTVLMALDEHVNYIKNVQGGDILTAVEALSLKLDTVLSKLATLEAKVDALPDV